MQDIYVKIPAQERTNFIEHGKTNIVDLTTADGNVTGSIRFIKTVNSAVIVEFRLTVNGLQEVYNLYSTDYGVGMLFEQPQGIGLEILEEYIKITLPDDIYNNIMGVQ